MEIIAKILVGFVALEHVFIFYMESFAWETLGKKTFRGAMPDDMFAKTKALAQNQGVYNGFLAAGLIWSLVVSNPEWSHYLAIFFFKLCYIGRYHRGCHGIEKNILHPISAGHNCFDFCSFRINATNS